MSGYAKQMIELAQKWLEVNPDPESPFLKVPGIVRRFEQDDLEQKLASYKREAHRSPEIAARVEELEGLIAQHAQAERDVVEAGLTLERRLNTVVEGVAKLTTPITHQDLNGAAVGRWLLSWARHGYNVFDLSADFTAAMLLTDARGLDIEKVRLPFGGILMMIPDGFARGSEGGHYTRIHIHEIARTDISMLTAAEEVSKAVRDLDPPVAAKIIEDARQAIHSDTPSSLLAPLTKRIASIIDKGGEPKGIENPAIGIYASDGAHTLWTTIEREGLSWDAFDALPSEIEMSAADVEAQHTIRRIVFGALAYVTAVERALEPSHNAPRKPSTRKPADIPTAMRWDVGRTVRIEPNLVRAVRSGSREVAFRLKHRHIVRGHYRNQPFGPGRAERRQQWIVPFWKGPEEGAALVHTYKLDEASK